MMRPATSREAFANIRAWVFDLDNTLYPAGSDLFAQVHVRMGEFISRELDLGLEEAHALQKHYYHLHGTTLSGLMHEHGIEPAAFLDYVHDIDYTGLGPVCGLGPAIDALPGRKFVFTNGSRAHAAAVTDRLGITGHFDAVFDIADAGYVPKPGRAAYETFLRAHAVDAGEAAMFEDIPANLEMPHALGMATVLITCDNGDHPSQACLDPAAPPAHIHHLTGDLAGFLRQAVPLRSN